MSIRPASLALLAIALTVTVMADDQPRLADWAEAPEASFLTHLERNEWSALRTDREREQFRDRYWARRDPTPATPRNEFKEIVEGRVKVADERFGLYGLRGSATARGMVFIILGSPAHVVDRHNTPVPPAPDVAYNLSDGNETFSAWTYDQLRTPRLLAAINRASLELTFRIEPSRRRDILENPGLFNTLREEIIDMALQTRPTFASAELQTDAIPGPALPGSIAEQLDRSEAVRPLSSIHLWRDDHTPMTLIWLHAADPVSTAPLMIHGRIRDSAGKTVAQVSREARPALGFTTRGTDIVVGSQLPLPPGTYDAKFIVTDSTKIIAAESGKLIVPQSRSGFRVSSLVLTDTFSPAQSTMAIAIGGTGLRPRSDATFARNESVWFGFQLAEPKDASAVRLQVMLRPRDGSQVQISEVAAALQPTGPHDYVARYEIPLATLKPGEYSLYVTVKDGEREEVRRADFRVVDAPAPQPSASRD